MRRPAIVIALSLLLGSLVSVAPTAQADGSPPVALIMLENHSYGPADVGIFGDTTRYIVGNPDAPYINDVLIPHATLFTSYYANSHPSLPNYIRITAGTTAGCLKDTTCFPDTVDAENLFDLLGRAGVPFASFSDGMPSNCYGADAGLYPVDHNPEVYYKDLDAAAGAPYGCAVTSQVLPSTLPDPLPAFTFIEPDRCHAMEGATPASVCPKRTDALISGGDAWLSRILPALLARGADVFVVFDEATGGDKTNGGGHVFAAEIGPGVAEGATDAAMYSHDSLLAALERRLGLSPLLGDAATATPLPDATGSIPSAPTVDAIAPTAAQPGDTVTLSGGSLGTTDAATVGGAAAAFQVLDDSTVSVVVPNGAVTGPIRLTTWGGTATSADALQIGSTASSITSVTPEHGVVGTSVSITGTGLGATSAVSFGGAAAAFTILDDAHVSAVVPAGATTGALVLTAPAGDVTAPDPFTVDPPAALVEHAIAHGSSKVKPSAPWPAATSSGDLLTAVLAWSGGGVPVPPSGWTLALKRNGVAIYDARPAATEASVSFGGSSLGSWILEISEWSGTTAAAPLDRTASATSGALAQSLASSGTTSTTSAPGEIAIAAIKTLANVAMTAPTNGFASLDASSQGTTTLGVFADVTGAPAQEGTTVTLGAGAKWRGEIVTLATS